MISTSRLSSFLSAGVTILSTISLSSSAVAVAVVLPLLSLVVAAEGEDAVLGPD